MISISTILKFSAQINFPSSCLCVNSNLEELRGHKVESVINLTFSWCIVCSCSSMYVLYICFIFIFFLFFVCLFFFKKRTAESSSQNSFVLSTSFYPHRKFNAKQSLKKNQLIQIYFLLKHDCMQCPSRITEKGGFINTVQFY